MQRVRVMCTDRQERGKVCLTWRLCSASVCVWDLQTSLKHKRPYTYCSCQWILPPSIRSPTLWPLWCHCLPLTSSSQPENKLWNEKHSLIFFTSVIVGFCCQDEGDEWPLRDFWLLSFFSLLIFAIVHASLLRITTGCTKPSGRGGVQLQPAGISQTCQSNRWTGARFKVQWRAQVVATLPEHFPHNATLRSPHSRRVGVVAYKHTCIHAGLHKRIHTPNIRGRHAQTVETESFTEGGIRVFSQLGD